MKPAAFKCSKCIHLIIKPHSEWGQSFSCAKYWYGGCSKPSEYSIRLCSKTKDFEIIKE